MTKTRKWDFAQKFDEQRDSKPHLGRERERERTSCKDSVHEGTHEGKFHQLECMHGAWKRAW